MTFTPVVAPQVFCVDEACVSVTGSGSGSGRTAEAAGGAGEEGSRARPSGERATVSRRGRLVALHTTH